MPRLFRPKKLIHLTFDLNNIEESNANTTTLTWKISNPTGQILSEHARIVLDNLYIKKLATNETIYLYTNDLDSNLCFDSKNKGSYGTVLFNAGTDATAINYNNYNPKISKNWKCKEKFLSGQCYFRIELQGATKADIEELFFTLIVYDEELELQEDTGPWSSDQVISGKTRPNFYK